MGIWTKKSITDLNENAESGTHRLKRTLGPFDLILLGIGAIVGAGLFSITGIAAAQHAGPAIIISFVIAATACTLAALCYSELASMIPISGSTYTYAYVTMGELVAWIIGWTLILEYAIGAAAVAISWSAYFVSFLHEFDIPVPMMLMASPWHPTHDVNGEMVYGILNLPAVLILGVMSLILTLGIKGSASANAVLVAVKVAVIVVFICVGIQYVKAENYVPFIPENTGIFGEFGWSGILRAAGIVFFAYIGFDCVSTAAQETVNPQKNMPRGILGALSICTVLYILFAFVMVGLISYKELNVAAPAALAIDQTPFHWLQWMVKLAIIAGFSSVILVLLLGQSRIFYTMACDGLLPKIFSDLHPRWHTPWKSSLALFLLIGPLAAFVPLETLGNMTSIGTLFAFVIVCGGTLILRYTHPEFPRAFRTPWVPLVPILGIATCALLMASLSLDTWLRLIIWLAIGLVIYGCRKWTKMGGMD
ncbi:MAG: amino acid permease [Parachlamydiaceae bacterium]|nr:amino acid permease [Parachlamydiaceae bacterium]